MSFLSDHSELSTSCYKKMVKKSTIIEASNTSSYLSQISNEMMKQEASHLTMTDFNHVGALALAAIRELGADLPTDLDLMDTPDTYELESGGASCDDFIHRYFKVASDNISGLEAGESSAKSEIVHSLIVIILMALNIEVDRADLKAHFDG